MDFNVETIKGKVITMKAQQGKKIELPENVDFKKLVKDSINVALADPEGNDLTKEQEKALSKITPLQIKIVGAAIERAAQDGLYENEVNEILGDVRDLIKHGWKTKGFDKLMKNPADPAFKLSPDMIEVIKSLDVNDQAELRKDLKLQRPDILERLSGAFSDLFEALLPIFKVIATNALNLGIKQAAPIINKEVGGEWASLLNKGLSDISTEFNKVTLGEDGVTPVAVSVSHVTVTKTTETHPADISVAGDHATHSDAV